MNSASNAAAARPDRIAEGVAAILASVAMMALADATVKSASASLTIWQIFVMRAVFALPILAVLARVFGTPLRTRSAGWVLARSALLVLTWLAFYAALPLLKLSVAAVAVYTNPIMIVLISALLAGEAVSWRRWLGVALGFAGVVAILRPGGDAVSGVIALPLLAASFYAVAMTLTRGPCRDEQPLLLAIALQAAFLATGGLATLTLAVLGLAPETQAVYPFLFGDWAPMALADWGVMAFLGGLSALYFLGVARAYQAAPSSIIATFDYAYLISAAFWGYVMFGERPDLATVGGMALITAAGLLVVRS